MGKIYVKLDGNLVPAGLAPVDRRLKEETKTITPDFSSGDVLVTPNSGKVLSQVTVVKDSNLVPENIKNNVNVFGVVGTLESVIELTQVQYEALSTYDDNTYYLIVKDE